jgi:hypothetical protein
VSPNKTLYVREDDMRTWQQAEQYAQLTRQSVSLVVAEALRCYVPQDILIYIAADQDDPDPMTWPGYDPGKPHVVYGRHPEHGMGWTLYYSAGPGESAGVDDHFIPGDRADVAWVVSRAREHLTLIRGGAGEGADEIRVEVGDPPLTRAFKGRCLVWPERDETRTAESGYDAGAYWGVALTKRGRIAVYTAHCNERWPAHLDVYDDLDDAQRGDSRGPGIPADIAAQAAAELGQERVIHMDI